MKGSRRTASVAINFYHKTKYSPRFGPIIRFIADMSNEGKEGNGILGCMDSGLEQRAMSKHRTDMMDMFHNDSYMIMSYEGLMNQKPLL